MHSKLCLPVAASRENAALSRIRMAALCRRYVLPARVEIKRGKCQHWMCHKLPPPVFDELFKLLFLRHRDHNQNVMSQEESNSQKGAVAERVFAKISTRPQRVRCLVTLLTAAAWGLPGGALAQNGPGSLDEAFAPLVPGPVRDLATTRDDRVIVTFDHPSYGEGRIFVFAPDGQGVVEPPFLPDSFAARPSAGDAVVVLGRAPFWDTMDTFVRLAIDQAGQTLTSDRPGFLFWQGPPHVAAILDSNQMACAYRFGGSGGDETVYLEPNRMWDWVTTNGTVTLIDNGIPVSGPHTSQYVRAFARQADGKVLIGGRFAAVDGLPRAHLARFLTNGTIDASFGGAQATNGADSAVSALAVQTDGRILIGGTFSNVFGVACNRIARLFDDGTVDPTFNAGAGPDDRVQAIAVMNDGSIVIAGLFAHVSGVPRAHVARLRPDGGLDAAFDPAGGPDVAPTHLALQGNGDVLIGGSFTSVNGIARPNLARLCGDGLRFGAPLVEAGLGLRLELNVRPGRRYVVEWSTDLVGWQPWLTNVPAATPWEFRFTNAPADSRFFRAHEARLP
jgi:uncharacterized delta-60 repeat protein